MILEFSDWLIAINKEVNTSYSIDEAANHCLCPWCRNFYVTVDRAYPNLRYFLSKFGADIEAPKSLQPLTFELYQASYCVDGKILRYGSETIFVDELPVTIEADDQNGSLLLHVGLMCLPWVLEESQQDVPYPPGSFDMFSDFR